MERLFHATKDTNTPVFSDPSHRMPQRPTAVKSGEGLGFQDLGSSFKPSVTYGKTSKGKSKHAETLPLPPRKKPPPVSEDESDDELLLSSQPSVDYALSPPKRVAKGRKQMVSSDEEEMVRVNGRVLKAHPDYKPSSLNALKGLRFTKSKKIPTSGGTAEEAPPPSSSLNGSQDLIKPISDEVEILEDPPLDGPSSRRKLSATRHRSQSLTRSVSRRLPDAKVPSTSKPAPSTPRTSPQLPAKPRPRPRIVTSRKRNSSPESTPVPKRVFPLSNKSPERPSNVETKRPIKKPPFPSPPRRELQEFPMSLQAKENISDGDASSSKPKKANMPRSVHTPKPLPLPSPLKEKSISRENTFPDLSPLQSSKNKGKARAEPSDDDEDNLTDHQGKRAALKPFPMSSQMLSGIDRRSKSPSIGSQKSTKRTSSDDSGAEQGHITKKRKDARLILDTFYYLNEPMDDDSIDLGHARDPSELCPYCDEDLPSHPTPFLKQLLVTARKKSYSDPRPKNRGGLKAPLTIYISVCQRHRFESHQLPIAIERGWPKTIDFTKVPARVKKMKKELEAIILDKDDVRDIDDFDTGGGPRGPRRKSVFWTEVKKEMKKQGSRAVVGVKGQFASFEKTQPGYYGEQGSVIIHQTLFDLFPPSTFDASLITPLAPAEFIQRVLVPEAAVRLIARDLSVDMQDAIVTLRDSAQYGVAMFPDTGENKRKGDEMGVADRIVMERARARRKELAEEEKVEKEMMEEERAAQRAKARESRREKAVVRAQLAKARAEGDAEEESATRGTRRGARRGNAEDSESDAMVVDGLASRRVTKKAGQDGKPTSRPNGSGSDKMGSKPEAGTRRSRERSTEPGTRAKEITAPHEPKRPFGGFAVLDIDGEHESTPRPARQQTTDISENTTNGLHARTLPLQMARNRSGASAPATRDPWTRSLRTSIPSDADSDASGATHASQRLDRPRIRKPEQYSWPLSDPSSPDTS